MSFHELLQNRELALRLEPEELAGYLLEHFNRQSQPPPHANNLAGEIRGGYGDEIAVAVMEAWAWLVREGLIVPAVGLRSDSFYQVSRRGRALKSHGDVDAWRNERWLPKGMLHPTIVGDVWSMFIRGQYEAAVFQAFKSVEVAVRTKCGYADDKIGTGLMRKAFDETTGPLTDTNALPAERQALANLFAGAIGSYKNPSSHRHVTIDGNQAAEMIVLASHLLGIVDSRSARTDTPP